ncbi:MAG: DUF4038 domain-containing protein [Kiritimatiellae bacterium]|nr:DUF4038 domain-containing protein [Kiritimatiellia bacterium]
MHVHPRYTVLLSVFCVLHTAVFAGESVETWRVAELVFESKTDYSAGGGDAVRLDVAFTNAETGVSLVRPAFWDGGKTFRVRVAPTSPGRWEWHGVCLDDVSLSGKTGSFICRPYAGSLELYRRGFVKATPGKKYFTYADGTPFFYLGDTHWGMFREELDEAGPHAGDVKTDSHFAYIVRRRVEQGFTVYQSEPLDAAFNLADGRIDASDLPGFRKADRYFRTIADAGLVHANAQFFFVASMRPPLSRDCAALERLSRYWVARFGAYPVMWTLGQECDNDFYAERRGGRDYTYKDNPWVMVAEFIHRHDTYGHPLSGHQENTWHTTITGMGHTAPKATGGGVSVFAPQEVAARTGHNWWAVQWSPSLVRAGTPHVQRDYWASSRPAVNYEGRYCHLWTKDFGARAQGWISFLSGFCGYGYGAIDIWLYKSTYDTKRESHDGVDKITVADKAIPWSRAVEFPSALQMRHLRTFLEGISWWRLTPDIGETPSFKPDAGALCACASIGDSRYVLYFYSRNTATGTIRRAESAAPLKARWFNPRTGEAKPWTKLPPARDGLLRLPAKPDTSDWTLLCETGTCDA